MKRQKKLSCKAVGGKYHWICREIDFYYFDGHRRYHLNKNLEKYDSAWGQLKKEKREKDQKMYVLTREARKVLWSGRILITQQLNELYS